MKQLEAKGAQVEETEWKLGSFSVPQLHVLRPIPFLIQLNDDEYVVEEADEFSEFEAVPVEIRAKLAACDARLEVGDIRENAVIADQGLVVFEGWTSFDPAHPTARDFLIGLATSFDGVFEDNVNGFWWAPDIE
jgi:hypothetical protein